LSGNSMGGSGTLGIGLRHGDVFAAIKANVPAGVEHASERLFLPPKSVPEGVVLPDPPICIDYSAQNDRWSVGHGQFAKAMSDRRYALLLYWGPFGHANNSAKIMESNDLIDSFDWLGVRKNEAYPVFTGASTNSPLPWPEHLDSAESGQVNGFFRWENLKDAADEFQMSLSLVSAAELETRFEIPDEASADVSLRRLQGFRPEPGAGYEWGFGDAGGEGKVDARGLVTIAGLKITARPTTLRLRPQNPDPAAARESDARLQAEGKGWRLDRARRDDADRPCVLLIGDSILNGYFGSVTRALAGKAYVDAWVNPHWQSEATNRLLAAVLDSNGPYDVVHFNMGLHGWAEGRIKPGTFEPLTRAYVGVLRAKLPAARLIWANSTPVTAKGNRLEFDAEINPIIVGHNRMAAEVMAAAEVPVNDFYSLLADRRRLAKGDRFHWTGPAYKLLGEAVVGSVLGALAEGRR
ncbi:MAG: SGNH/GDSL hydrolase family protein, partial [Verrucomicrobiales bacterium]|nr:SGNH/GDSL hydrolase family protein [Verrucomicrobiales bacterium]